MSHGRNAAAGTTGSTQSGARRVVVQFLERFGCIVTAKAVVLAAAFLALAGPALALNGDGGSPAATNGPSGSPSGSPPGTAPSATAGPQAGAATPAPATRTTPTCRKAHAPLSPEEQARRQAIRAQRAAARAAEGGGPGSVQGAGQDAGQGGAGTTARTVHRARPHLPPC